jgi:hypothetical protein
VWREKKKARTRSLSFGVWKQRSQRMQARQQKSSRQESKEGKEDGKSALAAVWWVEETYLRSVLSGRMHVCCSGSVSCPLSSSTIRCSFSESVESEGERERGRERENEREERGRERRDE